MEGAVSTRSNSMRCWMLSVFHPPLLLCLAVSLTSYLSSCLSVGTSMQSCQRYLATATLMKTMSETERESGGVRERQGEGRGRRGGNQRESEGWSVLGARGCLSDCSYQTGSCCLLSAGKRGLVRYAAGNHFTTSDI